MKRILLAILAIALLSPAGQAATVATSFTGTGNGNTLTLVSGQTGTYTITGTFVATIYLDQSLNGGATWQPLTSFTGTVASTVIPDPGAYRFRCSAYTSGTAVATLATAPKIYEQVRGSNGAIVLQVDDNGVSSTAFSGSGGGSTTGTFADVIVTDTAATSITTAGGISGTPATGTNTAGTNLIIQAATGTGSGAGGSLVFKTAPAGSTGTTPGTETTALTIDSTAAATFTGTVSGTQLTSTIATGTAPLVVASTTNVANLNASTLNGATFSAPGAIGGGTPAAATFTSVTDSGLTSGRVTFAGASGLLSDSSNFLYNNGTGAMTLVTTTAGSSVAGLLGVGGASSSANVLTIGLSNPLTGATQEGNTCVLAGSSAATGAVHAFRSAPSTAAASFTCPEMIGFYAQGNGKGSGSTITCNYGAYFAPQSNGTNNACVYIGNGTVSGNWALYVDTGVNDSRFAGTTEASSTSTASLSLLGGLGVAKRSFLGTIGSTFKGDVIAGVQDGTSDTAGAVGEVTQGTNQTTYNNFTTTNTLQQLAVLTSLAPGRYYIVGRVTYYGNGATVAAVNEAQFAISTTTASIAGAVEGRSIGYVNEAVTSSLHTTVTIDTDVNISTATSYFLNGKALFTGGNPQYVASLTAYRLR